MNTYSRLTFRFKIFIVIIIALGAGAISYLLLPKPALSAYQSYSQAVFDKHNTLLRISLAQDDRYRLYTNISDIAPLIQTATILYEDQDFYQHSGIDYSALLRAFWQTYILKERRIGASTIVMQVARLRWKISSNTISGKLAQLFRAIQLSRHYTKAELLEAYLNLAPYGGNIEGVGAASLIYFNKPARALNLAEAMALAVIPQNPTKRNPSSRAGMLEIQAAKTRLSARWAKQRPADASMLQIAQLPLKVRESKNLPYHAPHFVQYVLAQGASTTQQQINGTIDLNLQNRLQAALQGYLSQHKSKGFKNASALLLNHKTMHIEAMIGSADFYNSSIHGQVNGTTAKRSPGSTLKPFVYALGLDAGLIHPMTMLKDLPKKYGGFAPENFGKGFMGPISAQDALIKSRNVPAVEIQYQLNEHIRQANKPNMLNFYDFLKAAGVSQLREPEFYGLALALGGGETTMLELASLYAVIANLGVNKAIVSTYSQKYSNQFEDEPKSPRLLSPESAFLVFDMLQKNPPVNTLNTSAFSKPFKNQAKVAWKTGTSWAFRDAWAIGISGDYVLAVWIGNFDGTGNNAFIGRSAAGPLLFKLFDIIKQGNTTEPDRSLLNDTNLVDQSQVIRSAYRNTPFESKSLQALKLKSVDICQTTGDLYRANCPEKGSTLFIPGVSPIKNTHIYRNIWVNNDTGFRQCDNSKTNATLKTYAFWPSDLSSLFAQAGIHIEEPPKFAPHCALSDVASTGSAPVISSPQTRLKYVVQNSLQSIASIELKASSDADARYLYWFANGVYIASVDTSQISSVSPIVWQAQVGKYTLQVSDDLGRSSAITINVEAIN